MQLKIFTPKIAIPHKDFSSIKFSLSKNLSKKVKNKIGMKEERSTFPYNFFHHLVDIIELMLYTAIQSAQFTEN